MADHNAPDSVSRRNVLKTAGGLLAGATAIAGRASALPDRHGPLRVEVEKMTDEAIIAKVASVDEFPEADRSKFVLGLADQFAIHDDTVSLPNPYPSFATPAEVKRIDEQTYLLYFRTEKLDLSEVASEKVTLGLGVFPKRTVPRNHWDTDSVRFDE